MVKDERERVCVEMRKGVRAERVKSERGKEGHERERVCMKDCLVQSVKDIEPPIDPKANKMAMCCPAAISF